MDPSPDAVVVGGGVIGLAAASHLAGAGYRVVVVEREGVGSGATGASAGMLAPIAENAKPEHFETLLLQAFDVLLQAIPILEDLTGVRIGLSPGGLIHVPLERNRAEPDLRGVAARYARRGWSVEWIGEEEVLRLFPHLRTHGPVLVTHKERHLLPEALVRAYARLALREGADLRVGWTVTRVLPRGDHVEVRTDRGTLWTRWAVLAAGAWSSRLLPRNFRPFVPVIPVRGQMIAFSGVQVPFIVWTTQGYALPKGTFQYVGATVERVGFRNRVTKRGRKHLCSLAERLFPNLAGREPEVHWAGLRPGTPDLLPIVGWIPGTRILVASGHYRNGILLSELTARWVRAMVEGKTPEGSEAYAPARFNPESG